MEKKKSSTIDLGQLTDKTVDIGKIRYTVDLVQITTDNSRS